MQVIYMQPALPQLADRRSWRSTKHGIWHVYCVHGHLIFTLYVTLDDHRSCSNAVTGQLMTVAFE